MACLRPAEWCMAEYATASDQRPGDSPLLVMKGFSYAYPEYQAWALKDIHLSIGPGECHCVTGATGSGKSSLALAIASLLPEGRQQGDLFLASVEPAEAGLPVGLVLQNPDPQLLAASVGEEVAFGLENLGFPPESMPNRVQQALQQVGLARPFEFPAAKLSMGQKYRLLIAACLVLRPALLVLDEPVGQLDPEGISDLVAVIEKLKRNGVGWLILEHQPESFANLIDRHWRMDAGTLGPGCFAPPFPEAKIPARSPTRRSPPVVKVQDLTIADTEARPDWQGVSLEIHAGERVVLGAANGAGKTTFLRALAGFISPQQGEVRIFGERPEPGRLRGRLGLLFQNPQRQLFENTVQEEVAFSLKRIAMAESRMAEMIETILARCGILELAHTSPHKLSFGQRHLVALASILAPSPELLLLDDPFAGLDRLRTSAMAELLAGVCDELGTALLWTSHDTRELPLWAHRVIGIEGGTFVST